MPAKISLFVFFCYAFRIASVYADIFNIEEMTLEEKVGQLLITHFHGESVNEDARALIQDMHIGGIIYYEWANALSSPSQVQNLSNQLQTLAQENRFPISLFISTDQEGGLVSRLKSGFTIFPGNWALGRTKDPHLAESCAFAMGQEMSAVGINVDFAPVVDVNCNPRNPAIGIRAFSDSPEAVTTFAKSALKGFHQAHVIPTLKHFPGHGDVVTDSHESLPIVNKSKEELMRVELYPYRQLLKCADMVMTGHISAPALDSKECATFSKKILDGLLRDEMGFQGIVISDSLIMEGLLSQCSSIEEAALRAFNAGCDILLLGGRQLMGQRLNFELTAKDIEKIHRFLVEAVKSGQISEERINISVQRILNLKQAYGLFDASFSADEDIVEHVNTEKHQRLSSLIADRSVEVVKNTMGDFFSSTTRKIAVLAPTLVGGLVEKSSLTRWEKQTHFSQFSAIEPTEEEMEKCRALATEADAIVVCSYNAWRYPKQHALIRSILEIYRNNLKNRVFDKKASQNSDPEDKTIVCATVTSKDENFEKKPTPSKTDSSGCFGINSAAVIIALRDPQDTVLFPEVDALITTCSPTLVSLETALQRLMTKEKD